MSGQIKPSCDLRTVGLIITLAIGLLAAPLAIDAQQLAKVSRIGILWGASKPVTPPFAEAFQQGLRDLSYVEGQNIVIEERWADGELKRFPELAAELVRLKVDIIVAPSTAAALAAKNATTAIPIVTVNVGDPVASGLVASLARPGANITGLTLFAGPEIAGKYLELLKETVPKVSRVAVLWNPDTAGHPPLLREAVLAARSLRLELQPLEARSADDIDSAFVAMTKKRAGALLVLADPTFFNERGRIRNLAEKSRLPAIYGLREHVEAGGLMAYAPRLADLYRRAATYVAKILKGVKPADLPVEQPTKFELVINLKTAKALGLTFPPSVLVRADQVIE